MHGRAPETPSGCALIVRRPERGEACVPTHNGFLAPLGMTVREPAPELGMPAVANGTRLSSRPTAA
jgi:hypothetical protein